LLRAISRNTTEVLIGGTSGEEDRRILIDKNLDKAAEEIHKVLEDLKKRREAVRRELIRKAIVLRASGLTVNEVIEATGIPRSTLYRYL